MIEPSNTTQSDNKKDKTAIAFLYQSLPEEQLLQITKHKTAKAIWDALKTRHMGEQSVQQARLQTLKSDFEMLQMKEDETIDTFTGKLTTLANKAASLGHTFEDPTLVRKLLNAVPDEFLQIMEGFVGKGRFGKEEDNIEDVVIVVNDLYSSMIQTTLSVDFSKTIDSNPYELILLPKGSRSSHYKEREFDGGDTNLDATSTRDKYGKLEEKFFQVRENDAVSTSSQS
nr:zinc finger, CCHC-type [Tanacetum cinerariifolium]